MKNHQTVAHPIEPVYDQFSRILILGSFPSVKSRETRFYYGHPQNRFWKLLALLLNTDYPASIDEKKELLLSRRIALWDVIASCEIIGSSDSSIRNVVPNDLSPILKCNSNIKIYANGNTAGKLYKKYLQGETNKPITVLPSTSPANAAYSLERLSENWKQILCDLA